MDVDAEQSAMRAEVGRWGTLNQSDLYKRNDNLTGWSKTQHAGVRNFGPSIYLCVNFFACPSPLRLGGKWVDGVFGYQATTYPDSVNTSH